MIDQCNLGVQSVPDRDTAYCILGGAEDNEIFAEAGRILREGGVVAFPTETVYGLGASVYCEEAIDRVFRAKGRPNDNPLIAHIADMSGLEQLVTYVPDNALKLAEAYWPGPMTLVLPKLPLVPDSVTAGLDTVGVRMPSDPNARGLIKAAGVPVAAPSANRSGRPSPTKAQHVLQDMDGRIDMILDGGESACGLESTVIDCSGQGITILRPGYVTEQMIYDVTGVRPSIGYGTVTGDTVPKAPGMKYRHYAPKGRLYVALEDDSDTDCNSRIMAAYDEDFAQGLKCVILVTKQDENFFDKRNTILIGDRTDLSTVAHRVFDAFRQCDREGYDVIYMRGVPDTGVGAAIMNRVIKASEGRI